MKISGKTNTVNITLLGSVVVLSFLLLFWKLNSDDFQLVLYHIRIPRLLSAVSVAVILSLSGLALQALFRNDLAEPGILGISSGGTLGAVVGIFCLTLLQLPMSYFLVPTCAIAFSFASIYIIMKLAGTQANTAMIILLGVAINSFNGALITLISYLSDNSNLRNIVFWGMGSFTNTNLSIGMALMLIAVLLWLLYFKKHRIFNALRLDEENLFYAGYNLQNIQRTVIVSVTVAVGASVAFCGLIAFVGLVAPHIARLLVGSHHRNTVITTPLVAIALILFTDLLCKNILYPIELPTSVITSFIGAPYFIHLIFNTSRANK